LRFVPIFHVPFNRSALAYPTVRKNVTAAAFQYVSIRYNERLAGW